uniref:Uncharacterized protein n=1 Tax=Pipistrellus kuhlii TaxID=59472 RepID=A0A7J8A7Z8_PIPKU|nr:hypothetical protein mPipKuh1_009001 [Pipistrellus kuhlii]
MLYTAWEVMGQSWNLASLGNAQHYPPKAIYSHPQHPGNQAPPRPKGAPENSNTAAPTLVTFANDKAVLGLCFQGLHWQNLTTEALSTPAAQFEKWSKSNSSTGVNTTAKKIAYTMLSPEAQASIVSYLSISSSDPCPLDKDANELSPTCNQNSSI